MGILRTDKISGLETPTPVTGSVVFDGTGDYLDLTLPGFGNSNFTFELWFWVDTFNAWNTIFEYGDHTASSDGILVSLKGSGVFARNGSTDISNATINSPYQIPQGSWNHLALTREGTTARLHINGEFIGSATWSKVFTETNLRIASARYLSGESYTGYISNFRVLKGTALYNESNFTPPVHALEVIGDTVLLCCNNPDSAGADGTGKTITANGNAAASTFSPSLTRDFTSGTEFSGVTVFDTQGYFVPPSGTTEQRGRGRGLFGGGFRTGNENINVISYIEIQTQGNTQDFGDLTQVRSGDGAVGSSTRGLFAGGYFPSSPNYTNIIDFVTIATTGNAVNFGDINDTKNDVSGLGNETRGILAGGDNNNTEKNTIDFVTIASLGDATDFGDLTTARTQATACSSSTRGIVVGGKTPSNSDVIDYITIASTGNAADFGDSSSAVYSAAACSSSTRGVFGGGYVSSAATNAIEYVTISTLGNAQDFGDLTQARYIIKCAASNKIRGAIGGGFASSAYVNTIDFVTIASTGDAQDFGDLITATRSMGGLSDSHGGLS